MDGRVCAPARGTHKVMQKNVKVELIKHLMGNNLLEMPCRTVGESAWDEGFALRPYLNKLI